MSTEQKVAIIIFSLSLRYDVCTVLFFTPHPPTHPLIYPPLHPPLRSPLRPPLRPLFHPLLHSLPHPLSKLLSKKKIIIIIQIGMERKKISSCLNSKTNRPNHRLCSVCNPQTTELSEISVCKLVACRLAQKFHANCSSAFFLPRRS